MLSLNLHRRSPRHGFFLCFALLALSTIALAQGPDVTTPQRGFVPGASYALSDIEHINTTNGNVLVNFALGKLPPGRDGLSGGIYLIYNSKLFNTHVEQVPNLSNQVTPQNLLGTTLDGGWRYGVRYDLKIINRNDGLDQPYPCLAAGGVAEQRSVYIWKVKMTFPDGSEHLFRPTGYRDVLADGFYNVSTSGQVQTISVSSVGQGSYACNVTTTQDPNSAMTYYSSDGSYLRLTIPRDGSGWTLSFPDGGRVVLTANGQRVYDRNNNYFDILGITLPNGHLADKLIDQFGRSSYIEYDTANNQDYIYTTGVNNQPIMWTVKWKSISTTKSYVTTSAEGDPQQRGSTSNQSFHGIWRVVDQIIMPSQAGSLTYTFNYNPGTSNPSYGWGEISSITLPSTAQSSYQWIQDGQGPNAPALPSCKDVLANTLTSKTLSWQDEYDGSTTSNSATWQYSIDDNLTLIIDPDGGVYQENHGASSYVNDDMGLVSTVLRPDGSKTERIWQKNLIQNFIHESNPKSDSNPYLKTEFTSIKNAAGSYSQTAIKDYTYDKNGRVTQVVEYDWVSYSSAHTGGLIIPAGAPIKRVTVNTWNSAVPTATDTTTVSPNSYYQSSAPLLRNAIAASEVRSDLTTIVSRTESFYDNATTTGNLTQQKSWDSTKGAVSNPLTPSNSISVSQTYGTFADGTTGRLDQTTDAKGNTTTYTWGDIGNGTTGMYPTTIVVASNAPSIQRTTNKQYDFYTGLVTQVKDVDNNITAKTTYDALGRPTLVQEAFGTAVEKRTATEYSDSLRRVMVRADKDVTGDGKLISIQHYDQLGRGRLSRTLEDAATQDPYNEQHGIKVQTRYFSGSTSYPNNYKLVSNPYRATTSSAASSETTMGWARSKLDQGGRVIELQTFGGATLPAPWGTNSSSTGTVTTAYDANFTTVTDQAGKVRRSMTDGLGRLSRVDEPDGSGSLGTQSSPTQPTNYTYNALGNLTQTTQGAQTRTFNYSSLGRLTSATNPESGTVSYQYDANGNLTSKTDARSITTTYAYDALNRNTAVSYSSYPNGTSVIERYYDSATLGKGKPWFDVSYNYRWEKPTDNLAYHYNFINSYDALGRPLSRSQKFLVLSGGTWQTTDFNLARTYDLAGNVKTQTYPSGKTVSYSYDGAGRMSSFTGTLGDGTPRNYATSISYTPSGQLTKETYGTTTALYLNLHYNHRLQLVDLRLGDSPTDEWNWSRGAIGFYFGTTAVNQGNQFADSTDDNGNLLRQINYVPLSSSSYVIPQLDTYTYDSLNRVQAVSELQQNSSGQQTSVFTQTFAYDRWGNRTINLGATTTGIPGVTRKSFGVDTATNRLNAIDTCTPVYDAAGNQTDDCTGARSYDVENHITKVTPTGQQHYYFYDANGKRVRRIVGGAQTWGGVETWFVYGFGGEMVAEYVYNQVTPPSVSAPQKEYGYRNEKMLVVWDGTQSGNLVLKWLVTDQLGSTRMEADKSGSLTGMWRHDYLPFGEELTASVGTQRSGIGYEPPASNVKQKFTSKERDSETGLDFFQARHYANVQGRFTSSDEFSDGPEEVFGPGKSSDEKQALPYADIFNPQSLNKYQYCLNNPLRYIDPEGHQSTDLENIQRGLKALELSKKALERLGRNGNLVGEATKIVLERVFGKEIYFSRGGLDKSEVRFAAEVAVYTQRSFMGVASKSEPGIDGVSFGLLTTGGTFQDIQLISLKETQGGLSAVLRHASKAEDQAKGAGYKHVDLYIKTTNQDVDVKTLVDFIQKGASQGNGGIAAISKQGTIQSVTIFAKDGVVKVAGGKVVSCDNNGKCQ